MKESREKKSDSSSGQQESYDPGFIRVRVPIILGCHRRLSGRRILLEIIRPSRLK